MWRCYGPQLNRPDLMVFNVFYHEATQILIFGLFVLQICVLLSSQGFFFFTMNTVHPT